MANAVTLTFAGDTKKLESGFDSVGAASKRMESSVKDSGDAFERAADKSDELDTKAMGFRDTLTGIQDGALGVKQAAAGNWGFETFLLLGTGVGDLASGLTNFLIPALKASKLATLAKSGADKVAAAAQWAFNAAQLASPTTWIIIGIVALIAVIVLIAKKTDWFQRAWRASWGWIKSAASNTWEFIKKIPGWISSAFSRVANYILAPFRAAFNGIARAWNNTIGQLSWSVPSWVPFIGGNSISVPHLPTFHSGGVVPGIIGTAVPIMAQAGEKVSGVAGRSDGPDIVIGSDGSAIADALVEILAAAVKKRGGNVQTVLGRG